MDILSLKRMDKYEVYNYLLELLKAKNNAVKKDKEDIELHKKSNKPINIENISIIRIIPAHFLEMTEKFDECRQKKVPKVKMKCLIDVDYIETRAFDEILINDLTGYVFIVITTGPGFHEIKFIDGDDFIDYYKNSDFLLISNEVLIDAHNEVIKLLYNKIYQFRDLKRDLKEILIHKHRIQLDHEFSDIIDDLIHDKYIKMEKNILTLDFDKIRKEKLKQLVNKLK